MDHIHDDSKLIPNAANQNYDSTKTEGGSFNFSGTVAGRKITARNIEYSSNMIAMETDGRSISIGKSTGEPGPNWMKIDKLSID